MASKKDTSVSLTLVEVDDGKVAFQADGEPANLSFATEADALEHLHRSLGVTLPE